MKPSPAIIIACFYCHFSVNHKYLFVLDSHFILFLLKSDLIMCPYPNKSLMKMNVGLPVGLLYLSHKIIL